MTHELEVTLCRLFRNTYDPIAVYSLFQFIAPTVILHLAGPRVSCLDICKAPIVSLPLTKMGLRSLKVPSLMGYRDWHAVSIVMIHLFLPCLALCPRTFISLSDESYNRDLHHCLLLRVDLYRHLYVHTITTCGVPGSISGSGVFRG